MKCKIMRPVRKQKVCLPVLLLALVAFRQEELRYVSMSTHALLQFANFVRLIPTKFTVQGMYVGCHCQAPVSARFVLQSTMSQAVKDSEAQSVLSCLVLFFFCSIANRVLFCHCLPSLPFFCLFCDTGVFPGNVGLIRILRAISAGHSEGDVM